MSEDKLDQWAIVELFGHQRIAGRLSEQTIGGCSFVRVDVPETSKTKAYTKLYGQGAIYGITFVDEAIARAAADRINLPPVSKYDVPSLMHDAAARLPHTVDGSESEEFDPGDP